MFHKRHLLPFIWFHKKKLIFTTEKKIQKHRLEKKKISLDTQSHIHTNAQLFFFFKPKHWIICYMFVRNIWVMSFHTNESIRNTCQHSPCCRVLYVWQNLSNLMDSYFWTLRLFPIFFCYEQDLQWKFLELGLCRYHPLFSQGTFLEAVCLD